ncbi:CocE/NonD family hydrolase [Comamonadaceae bacterium G21597-S1]|nr:CocE/NonD family hydrolase [Comamonadaceae bacterium G21597-S1]
MTAWIPMTDGVRLAARIWLPLDAESDPVPALLEYLPYRRRDGTSHRDAITQPYMAGHGYAAVRVDVRGSGDSGGVLPDEYTRQEIDDGVAVIAWLAAQPWCSGRVGMWGISWGGINTLQVAARRPPALAAIVPMGFADDRYNGDCHFMGGCVLEGNISWGGSFFAAMACPPDPAVVGEHWRAMWLQRLEQAEPPLATWLAHPHRDAYWRRDDVFDDPDRIQVPAWLVNGWQDSYARNILPLLARLQGPKKALIGPWAHGWPHLARPGPAIGFLQEAVRWWDHWLKDVDNGVMDEPMLRVWMGDWVAPARLVPHWPGRWVAQDTWPAPDAASATLFLCADGGLHAQAGVEAALAVHSPQTNGAQAGYQCSYGLGPDLSDDQQGDDATSLCFDTAPLPHDRELLGEPELELDLHADQPQALLAARLCDVAPDGRSLRLSYGLLNLSHRDGSGSPRPLVPGQMVRVRLRLCGLAHRVPAGHRIRLALSNAYWPIAWPAPVSHTLTIHAGRARLQLPLLRPDAGLQDPAPAFGEPEGAPEQALVALRPRVTDRPQDHRQQLPDGSWLWTRARDRGAWKTIDTDVAYDTQGELHFVVHNDDPLSAQQSITLTTDIGRSGWNTRVAVTTRLSADAEHFRVQASLQAWEGAQPVFSRDWDLRIPREPDAP